MPRSSGFIPDAEKTRERKRVRSSTDAVEPG
jgi:hypothetical protein